MAFDRTDPADLLTLQTEVNTDPIGMGYAAVADNTAQLLKLLNDSTNNVGGDTASRYFDASAMMDALDPSDFASPQTEINAAEYTQMLLQAAYIGLDISGYKTRWRSSWAANSATVVALDAQNVDLSRAEVLFGQNTIISRDDWITARNS